ncbi:MAG: VOC family protein [Bacteroidales bacterium]
MKKFIIAVAILAILAGCDRTTHQSKNMTEQKDRSGQSFSPQDTTPKVTGIGGIFFFSENPEKTKEWYAQNLGLEVNQWGSGFEFRNANRPDEINYLQWSPFQQGSEYFVPSKKEFMINYRVQNIEGLVNKLKNNGVTVLDSIETYDYGKFVHIMDADGNKIELWEPVDSVLTAMGGKTTK